MQVNYNDIKYTYCESPQANPVRWLALKEIEPGVFVNTTAPFKCKDYFNDFVIYKHTKHEFRAHGMKSSDAEFNADGSLYVLVLNVTEFFEQNIKNILEPTMLKEWGATITVHNNVPIVGPSTVNVGTILHMSSECFASTFRISALMLFLRNCNVNMLVPDYDSRLDRTLAQEGYWGKQTYEFFKQRRYNDPILGSFVWYASYNQYDGAIPASHVDAYTFHDNGVNAWLSSLRVDKWGMSVSFLQSLPVFVPAQPIEEESYSWDEDEEEEEYDEV